MLLLIVFILLLILSSLIFNLYTIFQPFIKNLWYIHHYNVAYYWALWSIERALLALKYHSAWYEWSWWWIWWNKWHVSDHKVNIWILSIWNNWILREIKSRTNWLIPIPNEWNVDYDLSGTWSENYNKIELYKSIIIPLYIDNWTNPYTWWIKNNIRIDYFTWIFRLPAWIQLWNLLEWADVDWDWVSNDVILTWSVYWSLSTGNFSIFPMLNVNYSSKVVNSTDSFIREDIINSSRTLNFWNNKNPVRNTNPNFHNIIPMYHIFSWYNFNQIFQNSNNLHIKFSLVNIPRWINWVYPFLEYRFSFPTVISDIFYNIKWIWKVWEYEVNILIKKPVIEDSASTDFAIIF